MEKRTFEFSLWSLINYLEGRGLKVTDRNELNKWIAYIQEKEKAHIEFKIGLEKKLLKLKGDECNHSMVAFPYENNSYEECEKCGYKKYIRKEE